MSQDGYDKQLFFYGDPFSQCAFICSVPGDGDGDTRGPGCVTGRGYSGHDGCCCFFVLALTLCRGKCG